MTPRALLVIIPSGLAFAAVLVMLMTYMNERRSDRKSPLKVTLLITLIVMGSWSLMSLIIVGFGYGAWRFGF